MKSRSEREIWIVTGADALYACHPEHAFPIIRAADIEPVRRGAIRVGPVPVEVYRPERIDLFTGEIFPCSHPQFDLPADLFRCKAPHAADWRDMHDAAWLLSWTHALAEMRDLYSRLVVHLRAVYERLAERERAEWLASFEPDAFAEAA